MAKSMGEPRPPKPANQGTAKRSGPGDGTPKPSIRARNSHTLPGQTSVVASTGSIRAPGSGTSGKGKHRNPAPRT